MEWGDMLNIQPLHYHTKIMNEADMGQYMRMVSSDISKSWMKAWIGMSPDIFKLCHHLLKYKIPNFPLCGQQIWDKLWLHNSILSPRLLSVRTGWQVNSGKPQPMWQQSVAISLQCHKCAAWGIRHRPTAFGPFDLAHKDEWGNAWCSHKCSTIHNRSHKELVPW